MINSCWDINFNKSYWNVSRLLKLQRKIYTANNILKYFLFNEWDIRNVNISRLLNDIPSQDQEAFGYAHDLSFDGNTLMYYR